MANAVIPNTPVVHESGVTGAGPGIWYNTVSPDGDALPWMGVPVGSLYCKKTSTTAATWYEKVAANSADADWVSFAGTPANGALFIGGGTTAVPLTTAVANKNFVDVRGQSTATTGGSDTRAAYFRMALAGATTGGGDALRAYNVVSAAIGTAHGAHISLALATGGSVSGQGEAIRGTLELKSGANAGTLAGIQSEIWLSAADSAISGAAHGIFRASVGGDATNKATVKNLMMLDGVQATAASSGVADMVTTGAADSPSNTEIKVTINGTAYWLLATATPPGA